MNFDSEGNRTTRWVIWLSVRHSLHAQASEEVLYRPDRSRFGKRCDYTRVMGLAAAGYGIASGGRSGKVDR